MWCNCKNQGNDKSYAIGKSHWNNGDGNGIFYIVFIKQCDSYNKQYTTCQESQTVVK